MFERGQFYTRLQIHELLGGSLQEYLPHKNGMVVCGCFRMDTNPDAPDIILPGTGKNIQKWANVFKNQEADVPVFIKKSTNNWEYVGNYRVEPTSADKKDKPGGPNGIISVLFLKRVQ